jgi:hypothetical protein
MPNNEAMSRGLPGAIDVPDPRHTISVGTDPPGVKRFAIFCDESGTHDAPYYGFGTLWMPYQRRGTFSTMMKAVRARLRYPDAELKWQRVKDHTLDANLALVDMFFQTSWLSFHMLVVDRAWVDLGHHDDDLDLARRKHFTQFLANKIARCVRVHRGQETQFRVYADNPFGGSGYAKAHEAAEVIGNNLLAQIFKELRPIDRVIACDSKRYNGIQVCDLLLGATMDAWNEASGTEAKAAIKERIAHFLHWPDLRSDTRPEERKFNVWYLVDPRIPRPVTTRAVTLHHPLPPLRSYRRK